MDPALLQFLHFRGNFRLDIFCDFRSVNKSGRHLLSSIARSSYTDRRMLIALLLLFTLAETPFGSSVDRALNSAQNRDWKDAMAALDSAWMEDPAAFQANNLYYLRGRVAEEQQDWARAMDDFGKDRSQEPTPPPGGVSWRECRDETGRGLVAEQLIDELPTDFPPDLRLRLLANASPELALRIVDKMTTREARLQRALLLGDDTALWTLLRERNSDDVALQSARKLAPSRLDHCRLEGSGGNVCLPIVNSPEASARVSHSLRTTLLRSGVAVPARTHSLS